MPVGSGRPASCVEHRQGQRLPLPGVLLPASDSVWGCSRQAPHRTPLRGALSSSQSPVSVFCFEKDLFILRARASA